MLTTACMRFYQSHRSHDRLQSTDSVEKVASAAACRSSVPAVEVAASHFKLSSGVSLSVLAQVWG
ncbi:hypothetical protein, partial [Pseudomonas aeruginosa]|uniref:hypothetical protein n=1 Tax=Pseudomonas aeruginosa TaxID=287 RepID=UPI001C9DE650